MDLIKINYENNTTSAREVYDFVFKGQEKKTAFNVWISRAIKKYDFIEGKDFQSFSIESTGGRPRIDYAVTVNMGKELAMVAPTEQGKIVRQYFLKCEEIAKQKAIVRAIGKETRKTLTDAIEESGENERMHGRGHSNFTRLVYSVTGLTGAFKQFKSDQKIVDGYDKLSFRDTLTPKQLEQVDLAESLIKPLLKLEKEYSDIKATLEPLFKTKEIK